MAVLANRKASESVEWLSRCSAYLVKLAPAITPDESDAIALCIWENEHFRNVGPEAAVECLLDIADVRSKPSIKVVPRMLKVAREHHEPLHS